MTQRLNLSNKRRTRRIINAFLRLGHLVTRLRTIRGNHRNTETNGISIVITTRNLSGPKTTSSLNMRSFGQRRRSTGINHYQRTRMLFTSILNLTLSRNIRHLAHDHRNLHVTQLLHIRRILMHITQGLKIGQRRRKITLIRQRLSNGLGTLQNTKLNNSIFRVLIKHGSIHRGYARLRLTRGTAHLRITRRTLGITRTNNSKLRITRTLMRNLRLITRLLGQYQRSIIRHTKRLLIRHHARLVRLRIIIFTSNTRLDVSHFTRLIRTVLSALTINARLLNHLTTRIVRPIADLQGLAYSNRMALLLRNHVYHLLLHSNVNHTTDFNRHSIRNVRHIINLLRYYRHFHTAITALPRLNARTLRLRNTDRDGPRHRRNSRGGRGVGDERGLHPAGPVRRRSGPQSVLPHRARQTPNPFLNTPLLHVFRGTTHHLPTRL